MHGVYNVLPPDQAGACRTELVVIGNGRRLAIECDGEQFHGPERLQGRRERHSPGQPPADGFIKASS